MHQLMELLLGAQSSALTFIERMSARQLTARGLAFWGAALAIPLLFVGQIDIKLGLLGIVFVGFSIESALGLSGLRMMSMQHGGAGGAAATSSLLWGGRVGRAAWFVRGLMGLAAAGFAGWRLHERGRAHRELVAEVKALREALERVRLLDNCLWSAAAVACMLCEFPTCLSKTCLSFTNAASLPGHHQPFRMTGWRVISSHNAGSQTALPHPWRCSSSRPVSQHLPPPPQHTALAISSSATSSTSSRQQRLLHLWAAAQPRLVVVMIIYSRTLASQE